MIHFTAVDKWFGKLHVLNDINLNVKQGEVVVVCGPFRFRQINPHPNNQPA